MTITDTQLPPSSDFILDDFDQSFIKENYPEDAQDFLIRREQREPGSIRRLRESRKTLDLVTASTATDDTALMRDRTLTGNIDIGRQLIEQEEQQATALEKQQASALEIPRLSDADLSFNLPVGGSSTAGRVYRAAGEQARGAARGSLMAANRFVMNTIPEITGIVGRAVMGLAKEGFREEIVEASNFDVFDDWGVKTPEQKEEAVQTLLGIEDFDFGGGAGTWFGDVISKHGAQIVTTAILLKSATLGAIVTKMTSGLKSLGVAAPKVDYAIKGVQFLLANQIGAQIFGSDELLMGSLAGLFGMGDDYEESVNNMTVEQRMWLRGLDDVISGAVSIVTLAGGKQVFKLGNKVFNSVSEAAFSFGKSTIESAGEALSNPKIKRLTKEMDEIIRAKQAQQQTISVVVDAETPSAVGLKTIVPEAAAETPTAAPKDIVGAAVEEVRQLGAPRGKSKAVGKAKKAFDKSGKKVKPKAKPKPEPMGVGFDSEGVRTTVTETPDTVVVKSTKMPPKAAKSVADIPPVQGATLKVTKYRKELTNELFNGNYETVTYARLGQNFVDFGDPKVADIVQVQSVITYGKQKPAIAKAKTVKTKLLRQLKISAKEWKDIWESSDVQSTVNAYRAGDSWKASSGTPDVIKKALKGKGKTVVQMTKSRTGALMIPQEQIEAIYDAAEKGVGQLMKVAAEAYSMPIATTSAAAVLDYMSDDIELSKMDYMLIFGATVGARIAMNKMVSAGNARLLKEFNSQAADMGVQGVKELVSVAKSLPEDLGLPILKGLSDDVFNNTVGTLNQFNKKFQKSLDGAVTQVFRVGMKELDPGALANGTITTTRELMDPQLFLNPLVLRDSIAAAGAVVSAQVDRELAKVGGKFNPGVSAALNAKVRDFTSKWGISDEALSGLAMHMGVDLTEDKGKMSFLMLMGSMVESFGFTLKKFTGEALENRSSKMTGELMQFLGEMKMFSEFLANPTDILSQGYSKGEFQILQGLTASLLYDLGIDTPASKKAFKGAWALLSAVQSAFTEGNEVLALRLANFVPEDPNLISDVLVNGVYQAMLSSPWMWGPSTVANAAQAGLKLMSELGQLMYYNAKGDKAGADASAAFISTFVNSVPEAVRLGYRSAVDGVKYVNPLSIRTPYSRNVLNISRALGIPDSSTSMIQRAVEDFGESAGILGGDFLRGLDAASSHIGFSAQFQKNLVTEAYDQSLMNPGKVFPEILKDVMENPELVAKIANLANKVAKSFALQGGVPGSASGRVAEGIKKVHRDSLLVQFLQPFLGTSAITASTGIAYSPFGVFDSLLDPSNILRQYMNVSDLSTLPSQVARELKRARVERGSQMFAGLGVGGMIYGALRISGWDIVDYVGERDAALKKSGLNAGDIYKRDPQTGEIKSYNPRFFDNVRPALVFLKETFHSLMTGLAGEEAGQRGSQGQYDSFGANERGFLTSFGAAVMATVPKTYGDFVSNLGRGFRSTDDASEDQFLTYVETTIGEILRRINPGVFRQFAAYASGKQKTTMGRVKKDIFGNTKITRLDPGSFLIGTEGTTPTSKFQMDLARNGVSTDYWAEFTYGGDPIDDPDLQDKLGDAASRELNLGIETFQQQLETQMSISPEAGKRAANKIIDYVRGRALADHFNEIQEVQLRERNLGRQFIETFKRLFLS